MNSCHCQPLNSFSPNMNIVPLWDLVYLTLDKERSCAHNLYIVVSTIPPWWQRWGAFPVVPVVPPVPVQQGLSPPAPPELSTLKSDDEPFSLAACDYTTLGVSISTLSPAVYHKEQCTSVISADQTMCLPSLSVSCTPWSKASRAAQTSFLRKWLCDILAWLCHP